MRCTDPANALKITFSIFLDFFKKSKKPQQIMISKVGSDKKFNSFIIFIQNIDTKRASMFKVSVFQVVCYLE